MQRKPDSGRNPRVRSEGYSVRPDGVRRPSAPSRAGYDRAPSGNRSRGATPGRSGYSAAGTRNTRVSRENVSAYGAPRPGDSARRSAATAPRSRSEEYTRKYASARPAAQPQQRPPQPSHPAPRRRRKKDPLARIIPLGLLLIALIVGYNFASAWLITEANKDTYCDNIFVNGINISPYGQEEGIQAVRDEIQRRLNTTITLSASGQSFSFTAADFGGDIQTDDMMVRAWNIGHVGSMFDCKKAVQSLKANPIHLDAELTYDDDLVDDFVEDIYEAVYIAPTDAVVVMDVNQIYLQAESTYGQELDRDAAREQILTLLETGEGSTELPLLRLDPGLSTEAAMNSTQLIVEYQTDTSTRDYNSRANVRMALSKFDGMQVHPGETIDFNQIVGPRTEASGWQEAIEYSGNNTVKGFGGGVCQASSTLYGAILKAGMTILDRSPHGMTVSYVEPSLDAAVTDTNKNLVFINETETSIFIRTEVTKEYASVRIYGQRPAYRYELESQIVSQGTAAVHVEYVADREGKYVKYTDETQLYKKGRPPCSSNGWLVGYDWETGAEMTRTQLSHDKYASGTDIYWRGVLTRDGVNVIDAAKAAVTEDSAPATFQ